MNDLAIYGATIGVGAELVWYYVKGYTLKSVAEYRPLTKKEKIFGLLPFPLDFVALNYR